HEEEAGAIVEVTALGVDVGIEASRLEGRAADDAGPGERPPADAADVRAGLRPRVLGRVLEIDAVDARADALEEAVEQGFEYGAFVTEVEVERAARDRDALDDVVDGGVQISLLGEDLEGGVEDLFAARGAPI